MMLKIKTFRFFLFVFFRSTFIIYKTAEKDQGFPKNISKPLVLLKWSWILTAVSLLEMNKNCDFVTCISSKNKPPKTKTMSSCVFQRINLKLSLMIIYHLSTKPAPFLTCTAMSISLTVFNVIISCLFRKTKC